MASSAGICPWKCLKIGHTTESRLTTVVCNTKKKIQLVPNPEWRFGKILV